MTAAELPPEVVDWLQSERLVVLATASSDGVPATHVVSWVVAVDTRTVRFAVRHAAETVAHVRQTGRLAMEVVGDGFSIGARGAARIVREHMPSTPRENAMIELTVEEVVSHLPQGMALRGPAWDVPPGRELDAAARSGAVYEELRRGAD
ncbi:MAG: pyridoxamine 5'-phosphate oxidase family protein [Dehalococcoidia bacterium]